MTPIGKTLIVQSALANAQNQTDDSRLRAVAEKLEASFLSEMLKHAGLGETRGAFGGGVGEERFASFLRDAQAENMVKSGGIGLSEKLFDALKERSHGSF